MSRSKRSFRLFPKIGYTLFTIGFASRRNPGLKVSEIVVAEG